MRDSLLPAQSAVTPVKDTDKNQIKQTDLYKAFQAGHLIYGLQSNQHKAPIRGAYIDQLHKKIGLEVIVTIDEINNKLVPRVITNNGFRALAENEKVALSKQLVDYYHELLGHERSLDKLSHYQSQLEHDGKYADKTLEQLQQEKKHKYQWNNAHPKPGLDADNVAIKHSCKAAILSRKFHIHFILDGLDTERVIRKGYLNNKNRWIKDSGYTSSELRCIYKHWEQVKQKVTFYEDGKIVPAPWEGDKNLNYWRENYAKKPTTLGENDHVLASQTLEKKRKTDGYRQEGKKRKVERKISPLNLSSIFNNESKNNQEVNIDNKGSVVKSLAF